MTMRKLKSKSWLLGLALVGLLAAGCLVSGTFVLVEEVNFSFTADSGFYWWPVDLTADPDWESHQEDIDDLDALGLVFTIENTSEVTSTFNIWFAAATGPAVLTPEPTEIPAGVVPVLTGLTVEAGATRTITYSESLGMIGDLADIKAVVLTGRFDYYGTSTGGSGNDPFDVTDGKIIVTVSAGE
jgi:hypothetical protein